MEIETLVESSFSAIINAPIEAVGYSFVALRDANGSQQLERV